MPLFFISLILTLFRRILLDSMKPCLKLANPFTSGPSGFKKICEQNS